MLGVIPILVMSLAAAASGGAAAPPSAPASRGCHLRSHAARTDPMAIRLSFFASRLGVPPAFALAVADHESRFNPGAISPKGAIGVMQIMPGTAMEYDADERSLWDADVNMYTGLRILHDLLTQFGGRERLAAAAYIAGPGFWTKQYPPDVGREIEQYVSRVMELTDAYSVAIACE
jgi:soluble lytic murein transglycosylase-like protein